MKACGHCKVQKKLTEFRPNRAKKDGLQGYCRVCDKAAQREWYQKHKKTIRGKVNVQRKRRRTEIVKKLVQYFKTHPCIECGEGNPLVLEFDHLDPGTKTSSVSTLTRGEYSWDRVLEEIKKCRVLCANCHRVRTARQFGWTMLEHL